ncbi:hypothetical protein [Microbacterium elymi]|uniref:Uncharacterized protein n=1 Tax=Microbacterium elymi TaxID=2909587 RepID=A0ABY5NNN7_9MICO|nr:hypothetical protein [Microbacterium elymi]UUT36734.1 hypothetical protein L2X98_27100 [Microbacterium elymi]
MLHRHPDLHRIDEDALRRGMAVDISTALLFGAALVIAVAVPEVNYYALFLLFLTGVLRRLISRMMGGRPVPGNDR